MSFGLSPTDVINLVQYSTRLYMAFKDANENSETQVTDLVREFNNFHQCLQELSELMQEYGKPIPFSYLEFEDTLSRCEKTLEPYKDNLVDRKMSVKKFIYTIKYIGKEKEIDMLRSLIRGQVQALQLRINFLQMRLHLEATKQTQRLLDLAPARSMSFGGHYYTFNAYSNSFGSTSPNALLALPSPSDADALRRDCLLVDRWLRSQDERLAIEDGASTRPRSLGAIPVVAHRRDEQTDAVFYRLRRELEDANTIAENRAKRTAGRHLQPSEAMRREVWDLPPAPPINYTSGTAFSGNNMRFENNTPRMSSSTDTIRPPPAEVSPSGSPQIPASYSYFEPIQWEGFSSSIPPSTPGSGFVEERSPSVSTIHSELGASPGSCTSGKAGINTADTTPEDVGHPLQRRMSAASLVSIALGPGALHWNRLCHKVEVERKTARGVESRVCDLQWRYREDAGISIRSLYRSTSNKEVKTWVTQQFLATGPSIPLTTSYQDGDVSIDFPRASFGKLDKGCLDVKYIMKGSEASARFQTLLYTDNGNDPAQLLFDRPVATISSDLHKPECRNKNLRLWKKNEVRMGSSGVETVDVLVVLFYTSALADEKAHWVEEPHYIFEWLDKSVYKKGLDKKLKLVVSKEPGKFSKDKVRRNSSRASNNSGNQESGGVLGDTLRRTSTASSAKSIMFGGSKPSGVGNLNRFGYSELEIKFQTDADRVNFLDIWHTYVKPFGG